MKWTALALSSLWTVLTVSGASAQHSAHAGHAKPYAGLESRAIKSLSDEDIATLRKGAGWGLALPAELNGWPGPAHLLEMRAEIGLSDDQAAAIQDIYDDMKARAIEAGERLIAAEAALSMAFESSEISEEALSALLEEADDARAKLRFIHLSAHLASKPLLSDEQIRKYAVLRGYADDPCAKVPDGHNAEMWRKHNGCG